jgi:two-component system sensor kinase FixL
MVMMTEEGEITLVNTAVEMVFGYDREELIGHSIEVLIPDRLSVLAPSYREGSSASPKARALGARRELFGRRKDGSEVPVEVGVTPIETSEGPFVLASILDITERKRAEHETQRHRAELAHVTRLSTMGELATSLAHELNQPLTAILSNVQAAQRYLSASPPNLAEVREILKDVVQDDNRASEVIQRLRALVRKEPPALVALDVGDLLRDVLRLVHSDAILRHSRVSLTVAPGLRPVRGDRIQLQQVALNLLLNAFEAMRDCPIG